ncbi:MAG: PAS domain S-box protein [Chlorobi bacterium]|nr:PAS domain S-box protein [Chlorobiota bacterium]
MKINTIMGNYKHKSKTELIEIINSLNETITVLNKRLQKFAEPGKFGFFDWDLITNDIYLSPGIYIIYGLVDNVLNATEFINKFVHPDDINFVNKNLTDAIKGVKNYNINHRIIRTDGKILWLNNRVELIKDINGKPIKLLGTIQEITDRIKMQEDVFKSESIYRIRADNTFDWKYLIDPEGDYKHYQDITEVITPKYELKIQNEEYEALYKEYKSINEDLIIAKKKAEENEKLFKDILNTVPDPLSVTDIKTKKYIYINKGFEKITGYTEKEIIGKTVTEINIWKNYSDRELFVKQLKKNGFIQNFESEFKMKNGSILSGLISANVIYIQDVQNLLIITRDISKIKKTQNELIISENKFRTIVHYSHAGICLINENSELTYVNKQFCQITGYTENELINKNFVFLLDGKSKALVKKRYLQRQGGENVKPNYEISVLCKNKKIKRIEMHSGIIKKADGTIQTISQLLDITERKKAESELEKYREHLETIVKERTEKLESINQELIEANKDLGNFNELFINREFRIKELRNRVKELEEKL